MDDHHHLHPLPRHGDRDELRRSANSYADGKYRTNRHEEGATARIDDHDTINNTVNNTVNDPGHQSDACTFDHTGSYAREHTDTDRAITDTEHDSGSKHDTIYNSTGNNAPCDTADQARERPLIRSMTGFGEAACEHAGIHFFLELRSLNNRYFKSTIRLPEEYQGLEAEMEAALRNRLTRGSVVLTGSCTDPSASAAYTINHSALAAYIDQLKQTKQVSSGDVKIDIGPLLQLPGVLQPPANEEARLERARSAFMGLLEKACVGLEAMRAREGQMLLKDLLAQRDTIAEQLKIVAARAPQVVADYEARLRQRIAVLMAEMNVTAQGVDIVREIAAWAEKTDISEEITRLGGHIEQFTNLVERSGGKPIGRTLDFLSQEMLREANTMASKSNDVVISRAIVEVKGAIDRIKEQAANVE